MDPRPQPERWTLDGNQCVNCLSIGLVACLLPRDPWGADRWLAAALWGFVGLAVLNHLCPRRLHRLTHAVKAAYTQVLFASLATPGSWAGSAAVVVSGIDLLPLLARGQRVGRVAEGLGAAVRGAAIGLGFARLGFLPWLVVVFGACSAVYAWERRRRIARGRRYDYGLAHCLEHIAVWLYLLCLNADRLDLPWVWRSTAGVVGTLAIALVIGGMWINLRALRRLLRQLPPWFDPRLRPFILRKARDNARSRRWQHYVIKPFASTITNRRVGWRDIEAMLDRIELDRRFDVVVGVLSGGAFVARYLARRQGIGRLYYVRARLWSALPLWRNVVISLRYFLGYRNRAEVRFVDEDLDLRGRRVLVVDDSVCTGVTMASVRALCLRRGAAEVATLALFCSPDHPTDYAACTSRTPLVWPWGWEAD